MVEPIQRLWAVHRVQAPAILVSGTWSDEVIPGSQLVQDVAIQLLLITLHLQYTYSTVYAVAPTYASIACFSSCLVSTCPVKTPSLWVFGYDAMLLHSTTDMLQ